jgi:two-component system, cell cycle sensor histidine kinase and response regulator CckA
VMDLTIPGGMGGKETMRRILELDPNVKAVVSSGYSHDPVLAEHQAFGFKGVILKPYTQEQVQAAVRKALE